MADTETPDDSILNTTKLAIGLDPSMDVFDPTLIMHINACLSDLHQLNVGPEVGFEITSESQTWTSFMGPTPLLNQVKSWVYLKVKLMFDVSTLTGPVIEAMERRLAELTFRILIEADKPTRPIDPLEVLNGG